MISIIKKHKHVVYALVVVTALCMLIYASAQQDQRQSANDPQIQIAQDTASSLSNGATIDTVIKNFSEQPLQSRAQMPTSISTSLSPFLIVYDSLGKAVAETATLDGQDPLLPDGIFEYVDEHTQDRLTWQPKAGVRTALIVVPYHSSTTAGYVAVGRSLREVEAREHSLTIMIGLGWIVTIIVIVCLSLL